MVKRIVIYGYAVPTDRIRGAGSGVLIDLTYFVDDEVRVEDVFNIIKRAGYKITAKYIDNEKAKGWEVPNRIDVEDWDSHIMQNVTVGSEQMPPEASYDEQLAGYYRNQGRF